jgi:hypothetical protein
MPDKEKMTRNHEDGISMYSLEKMLRIFKDSLAE